jgi:hypothetical protein
MAQRPGARVRLWGIARRSNRLCATNGLIARDFAPIAQHAGMQAVEANDAQAPRLSLLLRLEETVAGKSRADTHLGRDAL